MAIVRKLTLIGNPVICKSGQITATLGRQAQGYAYSINDAASGALTLGEIDLYSATDGAERRGNVSCTLYDKMGRRAGEVCARVGRREGVVTLMLDSRAEKSARIRRNKALDLEADDDDDTEHQLKWVVTPDRFATGRIEMEFSGKFEDVSPFGEHYTNTVGPRGSGAGQLRTDVPETVFSRFCDLKVNGNGHLSVSWAFKIEDFNIPIEHFHPQSSYPGVGNPPPPLQNFPQGLRGRGAFSPPDMAGLFSMQALTTDSTNLSRFARADVPSQYGVFLAQKASMGAGQLRTERTQLWGCTVQYGPGTTYNQILSSLNNWVRSNTSLDTSPFSLTVAADGDLAPEFVFATLNLTYGNTPSNDNDAIVNVGAGGAEPPLAEEL